MHINRKTRDISKFLKHLQPSNQFMLGVAIDAHIESCLIGLGFESPISPGQSLLPPKSKGPATRRNSEGFEITHRDQPMEIAYRQAEWHWKQFSGHDSFEEKSKIVDIPYKRYPRTPVPPYSVELAIKKREDGAIFVVAGPFLNNEGNLSAATNTANMLHELFNGFEILSKDLASWISAPVRRLNWRLLPLGKNPWVSAGPVLEEMIRREPAGNQSVLRARLTAVGEKKPDFVAVGLGGFDGYTVFGFSNAGVCVLESPKVNNATYLLPMESWEAISQMTKAEILDTKAHKARLIHNRTWFADLDRTLNLYRKAA